MSWLRRLLLHIAVSEVQHSHPSRVFEDADAVPTICEQHYWSTALVLLTL